MFLISESSSGYSSALPRLTDKVFQLMEAMRFFAAVKFMVILTRLLPRLLPHFKCSSLCYASHHFVTSQTHHGGNSGTFKYHRFETVKQCRWRDVERNSTPVKPVNTVNTVFTAAKERSIMPSKWVFSFRIYFSCMCCHVVRWIAYLSKAFSTLHTFIRFDHCMCLLVTI